MHQGEVELSFDAAYEYFDQDITGAKFATSKYTKRYGEMAAVKRIPMPISATAYGTDVGSSATNQCHSACSCNCVVHPYLYLL